MAKQINSKTSYESFQPSVVSEEPGATKDEISALVAEHIADADRTMDVTIPLNRRLNQEQEKMMKDIQEHFDLMGLKFEDLSASAQSDINYLAELSTVLGISEPTLPKMLTALSEIKQKQFHYDLGTLALEDAESRLSELHKSQVTIRCQLKMLQEESRSKLKQLADDSAESSEKHEFFAKKCSYYLDSIQNCLASLQSLDFTEALSHTALMERRKKLDEKQAKVMSLKTEIETFHNLPPNIDAAKQELKKCKEELRQVTEQITIQASEQTPFQL